MEAGLLLIGLFSVLTLFILGTIIGSVYKNQSVQEMIIHEAGRLGLIAIILMIRIYYENMGNINIGKIFWWLVMAGIPILCLLILGEVVGRHLAIRVCKILERRRMP